MPFAAGSLYQIRATVADHAARVVRESERVEYLVLIASELVVNAIRHGDGHGRLRMWFDAGDVYLQVADYGRGMVSPAVAGAARPVPGRSRGRGLWVVRTLADHVAIDSSRSGTTVTVRFALDQDAPIVR